MAARDDDVTEVDGGEASEAVDGMPAAPLRAPGPQLGARRRAAPGAAPARAPATRKILAAGRTGPSESRQVPTPVIKGRLLERLRETAQPRTSGEDALFFEGLGEAVVLEHREHHAVVALACMVLDNLRRVGGSRMPHSGLEAVLEMLLPHLSAKDLMDLEVEAYEMLAWLGRSLDPTLAEPTCEDEAAADPARAVPYDPEQARIDLIRRAAREAFDLQILYYTGGRGELTTRRVTPQRIEAEKYLHAFCHTRQEERVFRISRIAGVEPIGGQPVPRRRERRSPARASATAVTARQTSLFGGGGDDDEG